MQAFFAFYRARQHAVRAEHDIVMANPSVCLSNHPMPVLCPNFLSVW